MTQEMTIMFAILGIFISGATFIIGRTTAAKHDGAEMAGVESDIKYLRQMVDDIKSMLKDEQVTRKDDIIGLENRIDYKLKLMKEEIDRLNSRIDETTKKAV